MSGVKPDGRAVQQMQDFALINASFQRFWANLDLAKVSGSDIKKAYGVVGKLLIHPQHTMEVAVHFRKELLSILLNTVDIDHNSVDHKRICVALAKIVEVHPDTENFVMKYFQGNGPPFDDFAEKCPPKKKIKMAIDEVPATDLEVVWACYTFLKFSPDFFRRRWKWSIFFEKYSNHDEDMIKWLCCQCMQIVTGMNEAQFCKFLSKIMSEDTIQKCVVEYEVSKNKTPDINQLGCKATSEEDSTMEISKNVVSIGGIYLPILQQGVSSKLKFVEVESSRINLQKVALGIAANRAVYLQGPVGSGKTFLVEYLAEKTGRVLGENFVKVQLGDQTDSKMLLGTYRCTDIPGEFVWQPGVLTQAVVEGSWLLLEDIDLANMDIASVLTALLENKSLTVPGYRDSIPVSPSFQLFLTQRFGLTTTGYYKKHSSVTTLLEKHVLQISLDPLSSSELQQIIQATYPLLKTISSRMVNAFLLFTTSTAKSGRLISARDLFKWCSRAAVDFDVTSQNSALNVLQDAMDVFCCAYLDPAERLSLAREISSCLGIISEKANYFCNKYKPSLSLTSDSLKSGRVRLQKLAMSMNARLNFCFTRPAACLLERVMCCVKLKESVLLVGETGTGKTSAVQYLAHTLGVKLVVINMNQQSDSADLLGGYKPVDLKFIIAPIKREFENIFKSYFSIAHNKKFLANLDYCFNEQKWGLLLKLIKKSYEAAMKRLTAADSDQCVVIGEKRTAKDSETNEYDSHFMQLWTRLGAKLQKLELQLKHKNVLAFSFMEGSLVKAVENGSWVLLDEINLANAETLECLSGLLEGTEGSLSLLERGDKKPVERHPQFTLFACMNPSTDVGKRDLPAGLRNRFTEFFVDELTDKNDLLLLVDSYLNAMSLPQEKLENIVKFYLNIRKEAQVNLCDGLGHKPHFSLRTLCRALMIAARNPCGIFSRSLYEAFCLSFLTQLDIKSYKIVESLITKYILGTAKDAKGILKQEIRKPKPDGCAADYLQFEGYWVGIGSLEPDIPTNYVLTECVRRNLKDLVRVVSIGRSPVLLQGDTSVGKTSLIMYLAKASGNKCVRINNHEHTDLQEYIGSYVADVNGRLVFREGLLVEAMRYGHWIILDELNLAPTDVLEALNRVLDDNRELFIPETQETVKAHPNFMLFATQNPPGVYGGRKMLSRAFRNRFVELHFNEIPSAELEFILHKRCEMPPSYTKKMVAVMTDLQTRRRGSAAFAGKHGFMTLRDLFRWGERYRLAHERKSLYDWDQHIADEGFLLLAGRVRKTEERNEIAQVLQKHMKRQVIPYDLFTLSDKTSSVTKHILQKLYDNSNLHKNIVWTYNMRQLFVLVAKALEFHEPVLLVGETGGGKTTICKIIAENSDQELYTVNCHMHSESSDFIGGLRPVRDHSDGDLNRLFEWVDGPLIKAMVNGDVFLADEISLADDSVLERLNSLLEPERNLLLAEKGTDLNSPDNSELVNAHSNFHFIGTMNPGGDYGKKELSPALRNRFTEIWCEPCNDRNDLIDIIEQNIAQGVSLGNQEDGRSGFGKCIIDFIEWFKGTEIGKRFTISIRDILTWVNFINACADKIDVGDAYLHGACLTFLDSFGSGVTSTENTTMLEEFCQRCLAYITKQLAAANLEPTHISAVENLIITQTDEAFGIKPFFMPLGCGPQQINNFEFEAPTCAFNTLRLLRGLHLNKAILLEGSPGVGKTSLVMALAKVTRNHVLRINLSDQTDISDLFGADLPVEGGTGGQFAWRDGPFLQALKKGHWILLDELNLASQSVLEGLNACLDHRGEIFIPELGKTFHVKQGTRLFACQNPLKQGGSRRGLPQSFLNRFTQVYINPLKEEDLLCILTMQFPRIPKFIIETMLNFNTRVASELSQHRFGHRGAPWEFNLRDLTRWCKAVLTNVNNQEFKPENFVQLIYCDRMRTVEDKRHMTEIFEDIFGHKVGGVNPVVYVTDSKVHVGDVCLNRSECGLNANILKRDSCLVLRSHVHVLRSLVYCVNLNWMSILVGSSGSGKSSVVKTLASLAGKTLHTLPVTSAMDTTDILGGFEQTDYTRHLEEIIRHTEGILLETVQNCLTSGDGPVAFNVLRMWENFSAVQYTDTETKTMVEETKLFLDKLQMLEQIWKHLSAHCHISPDIKKRLHSVQDRGRQITNAVKKEGNLNAGGKFEWVDSILIKSLQEGTWLLVDNVNLCSPAVLDRLNALLEPGGVLTIGERGVRENGEMVEIKPHQNFRLFLTMDPKNGEISRAMRNRGIEIYMPSESESDASQLDVKSLVNQAGLKENRHINVLLKIHRFVSDIILGEKPGISQLLQASFLISQQLSRGKNSYDAFWRAAVDVYYKSRAPNEFEANDALNLIQDELRSLITAMREDGYHNENATLRTANLARNSALERTKQHCVPLQERAFLRYCLLNYYSTASAADLKARHEFARKCVLPYLEAPLFGEVFHQIYLNILESFSHSTDHSTLPLDFHWIADSALKTDASLNNSNRMYLFMYFFSNINLNITSNDADHMTLRRFLSGVREKKVEGKIDDILESELLNVFDLYDKLILRSLKNNHLTMRDEQVIDSISLLQWRFALHRLTNINIQQIKLWEYKEMFSNLHVHYKWFYKFAVKKLFSLFNIKFDDGLFKVLHRINTNRYEDFSILRKISRNFQKVNNKPPPLINQEQVKILGEFQAISNKLDLYNKERRFKQNLAILFQNSELKDVLIKVKMGLDFEFHEAPELFSKLKECDKLSDVEESNNLEIVSVFDYLSRMAVMKLKSHENLLIEDNNQLLMQTVTVPFNLLGLLQRYNNTQDVKLTHELKSEIFLYLLDYSSNFFDNCKLYAEHKLLPQFAPTLSVLIVNMLVSDIDSKRKEAVKMTPFGSYREAMKQHTTLGSLMWQNLKQISDDSYDSMLLEAVYAQNSYNQFILQLSDSLRITHNKENLNVVILNDTCLRKIEELYTNSEIQDTNSDKGVIITMLENCAAEAIKLNSDVYYDKLQKMNAISNVLFLSSYLKALFNSKLSPVDPLVKIKLKKQYCLEEIEEFSKIVQSYRLYNDIISGNEDSLHSYVAVINSKIEKLKQKDAEFGKYVAVRPQDVSYTLIVKEFSHHFIMYLKPTYILTLFTNVNKCFDDTQQAIENQSAIDDDCYRKSGQELTQLMCSYEKFIELLKRYRHSYPDIVEPLLSNLAEFLYSLRIKYVMHRKLLVQYNNSNQEINISYTLISITKFPVLDFTQPNYVKAVEVYTSKEMQNFIGQVFNSEENTHLSKQENFRLLKCGIQELYNILIVDGENSKLLDESLFRAFNSLLGVFIKAWKQQQEELEIKKKEEESLYKIKSKSEEDEIEEDFKQLFPNFHDVDFLDFQEKTLENVDCETSSNLSSHYVGVITLDDVKFVYKMHSQLLKLYTKTEWLNPAKEAISCDFVVPLIQKCKLLRLLLNKYSDSLDYTMDAELLNTLNVLLAVANHFGDVNVLSESNMDQNKNHYDFYKHPRVEEVKASYHILEELRLRLLEFLSEWPEHPTLQAIQTIIERIYNFDITSPLSRFLTGFEILLSKCHQWEENAHAGVSLVEHVQSLVQQIIAWRKIEMSVWKDSLNSMFERMNEPITKWWFYIYEVMMQFTQEDTSTTAELISTLQKFVVESNLAEFSNRLSLLMTFHQHGVHLPRTDKTEIFVNVLWNIHEYFRQFLPNVESKIKELRAPIEKKLKEYVKIVRWKDINYWAIKATLEKTHKTLHKYMREFQDVLKQPVSPCLTAASTEANIENVGIWDRPQRHIPKPYHYTMDPATYMAKRSLPKKLKTNAQDENLAQEAGILAKSEKYFQKSRLLCKDAILATSYPNLVQNLDGFVSDVIEASNRLQSLEVDKSLAKDKQKSQAKGILQQKRKALADLFKNLSTIGLSYRTGIVQSKIKDNTWQFVTKPIDLRAAFQHVSYSRNDEKLLTIWDSCEMYCLRALARLDTLDLSLKSPAKDLGLQNVERCKGFSEHLMILLQEQKTKLVDTSRLLYYLRFYSDCLGTVNEESDFISIENYKQVREVLKNTVIVMEQYKIVLLTCPVETNLGSELHAVPVLAPETKSIPQYLHDPSWNVCMKNIHDVISLSKKLLISLEKSRNSIPCNDYQLATPSRIFITNVNNILTELDNICLKINDLTVIFGEVPQMNSAIWLKSEIDRIKDLLLEQEIHENNFNHLNGEDFRKNSEKFLEKILIVMQNIYKKYQQNETSKNEDAQKEDDVELKENHLKALIIDDLFHDISTLEMNAILQELQQLVVQFYRATPREISHYKSVLAHILPILEQIVLFYEYFVTQQVSAYRVTCKMSSILSNIFINLATNGFCVPPEFSEELNSEGQSQQTGSGLGLGEGEGEKDVSDRIESEDQLDEAQPSGQEKEKQDDKDCKEEDKGIEMSEDFDGKLQDVEKGSDEEDEKDDKSNEDADEQMGETGKEADQLDQQIWGSDNEGEDDEEQDHKEEKGEKGKKEGQDELGAKGEQSEEAEPKDSTEEEPKEKNKKHKEINEMEEPELDDEQVDPYHGNHPEYAEPEPMDLPEDLELDKGMKDEEETGNEENPFDIDTMKEQMPPEEEPVKEENKKEESKEKSQDDGDSSSDEEPEVKDDTNLSMDVDEPEGDEKVPEQEEDNTVQDLSEKAEENKDKEPASNEQSAVDQTQTNETNVQPMDVDDVQASDNVQTNPSKDQKATEPNEEVCQEDRPDKEGVGQSRMEDSKTGHKGQANAEENMSNDQKEEIKEEMQHKPGESDSKRTLGDKTESVKKKLKTMDVQQNESEMNEDEDVAEERQAEIYQHIKEAEGKCDQILDTATQEQAEQQKEVPNENEDKTEEPTESSDTLPENKDEEEIVNDEIKQKAEKIESEKKKQGEKGQHPEGDVLEELQDVVVEGEIVETSTVSRGGETTYHTQYSSLSDIIVPQLTMQEINQIRAEVENQLSVWKEPPTSSEAEHAWEKISSVTSSLAQNLSEQLRLVLEPTQASRLKGDYRTGRRINMRKVIPYIASQFRKDKIWLRRTKPSKREYQIALAIDDSSSMSDNHSKELAFESVALISKALTLLESGQLAVLSFGETTEVLHRLSETFTEKSGSKLLQKFQFDQKKTCTGKLVDFVTEMLTSAHSHSNALIAKLLIIVSDGRGIFSEGEACMHQAVRRAKLANIFMVFVIIDNPQNKDSILDIRMPVFKEGKLLEIKSYMDSFPFPFYIILKDINSLPNVLSDALRQWFEIVSNIDNQ